MPCRRLLPSPPATGSKTLSPAVIRRAAIAGLLATAASCATSSHDDDLPDLPNAAFSPSGTVAPPAQWWIRFEDPKLDQLIRQALDNNPTLAAAWDRLRSARALARGEASALFPAIEGLAGVGSQRDSRDFSGDDDRLELGLTASYEVDLWGRIEAGIDAARLRAKATRADYETTAITLSSDLALTWYRLAEVHELAVIVREQIAVNEKLLTSLENRFRGGQIRRVDILRQRRLLEATRQTAIEVEADRQVLEHQLAVLLGRAPQQIPPFVPSSLPDLPELPATGLPSDVVMRRPDLQAALLRIRAADQDLAAAISNRYPRLNLTAALNRSTEDIGRLFEDWARSIAAELMAPIVDGGRRRSEVERTRAAKRQLINEFTATALDAFREVEDTLARESLQRDRITSLRDQLDLQTRAYQQLRLEFFNGVSDFIDVLTSLTDAQQIERDLITARRQLVEFRIILHRSIAGPLKLNSHQTAP